jgi:hypothetical protein
MTFAEAVEQVVAWIAARGQHYRYIDLPRVHGVDDLGRPQLAVTDVRIVRQKWPDVVVADAQWTFEAWRGWHGKEFLGSVAHTEAELTVDPTTIATELIKKALA